MRIIVPYSQLPAVPIALRLCVSIPVFAIAIHAVAQSGQSPADDRGSLTWQARQAKESGRAAITISTPDALWAEPESLNDALAHTTLTLAALVATETTHTDYEIVTWRKYHILERLSSQPVVRTDPLPESVPPSLLPIGSDEFVIPELGGTVYIDGVAITMQNPEVSIRAQDKRHLMFLLFRASGALAVPNYGPHGQFSVDDSGDIHAWVDADTNPLRSQVLNHTGGKLPALRELAAESTKQQKR